MADPRARLALLAADVADDLLAYLVRRVPDRDDATDLLGETLLALAAKPQRIPDDPEQARMWAFGVARTVLKAGRRRHAQHSAGVEALRAVAQQAVAGHAGDDDDAERRRVRAAVRALPQRDRELLMLVHWDGFSLQQAADHLRLPASTARTRYARAKAALRVSLQEAPVREHVPQFPALQRALRDL